MYSYLRIQCSDIERDGNILRIDILSLKSTIYDLSPIIYVLGSLLILMV